MPEMTGSRCSCGFTEVAGTDETIGDHLRLVFTPDDDRGPDGKVHLEGEADLFCTCGIGGSAERLDSHFLEMFVPADRMDSGAVEHQVTAW